MSENKTVLWPDLSRFGASLTVASNPTVGTHYLKFSIWDRQLYAKTCGLPHRSDIVEVLRDAGFAYAASESKSRSDAAYDLAIQRGASVEAQDAMVQQAASRLYFYSPTINLKKEVLQQFVPEVMESDYRQMPVAEVKHLDYSYMSPEQAGLLVKHYQAFPDAEPGVYFTTRRDREIVAEVQAAKVTLNEILEYKDFPPERVVERAALDGALAEFARFNSLPAIEAISVGQTLSPSGLPLKAPRPGASVIGYASKSDAVAANGGSEDGVEMIRLENGFPIAFEYPGKRLLILKDARFLEIPNILRLPDEHALINNVARHWKFLEQTQQMQSLYEQAKGLGYLEQERWGDRAFFKQADEHFSRMQAIMAEAGTTTVERLDGNLLQHVDLIVRSGLRPARFETMYSKEFLNFLGTFKKTITPELLSRRAELIAQEAFEKGAQSAQRAVRAKNASIESGNRREDAGEKIGGARKDYARSFLRLSEVDTLTVREMGEVVNKDNVWPPLDYVAMRENGVDPAVAYVIRDMRKALPVSPLKGGYNIRMSSLRDRMNKDLTPEMCRNFVNAVSIVRDAISGVRTYDELLEGVKQIREKGELRIEVTERGKPVTWLNNRQASDDPFPDGAGYKFVSRALPEVTITNGILSSYWLRRMVDAAKAKTQNSWDWAIKEKPEMDAEAEGVELDGGGAEAAKEKKERPEPVVPHLEDIRRVGSDFREGRDVDEALLMEVFGFRSIEYGNWLPQNERQVVLNHAYDAFMDLANALRLPSKAMSLGGELAVAFGSRGTGGKRAALAHYEPGRNVINLTRLKGAGSLAHEWGHAFDYWLSKVTGLSSMRPVSEMMSDRHTSPIQVLAMFNDIISESRKRLLSKDEVIKGWLKVDGKNVAEGETITSYAYTCLRNWVLRLDLRMPEDKRNGVFREFSLKALNDCFAEHPTFGEYGINTIAGVNDLAKNLLQAIDLQVGVNARSGVDTAYPGKVERWYNSRLGSFERRLNEYTPEKHFGKSRFLEDAEYYDGFRSKPYWSTRVEMFARAFETWVQDRIESDGQSLSQYLVYGKGEDRDAEHSGYPRGDDRCRVADKMEAFFAGNRAELVRLLRLGELDRRAELANSAASMPT